MLDQILAVMPARPMGVEDRPVKLWHVTYYNTNKPKHKFPPSFSIPSLERDPWAESDYSPFDESLQFEGYSLLDVKCRLQWNRTSESPFMSFWDSYEKAVRWGKGIRRRYAQWGKKIEVAIYAVKPRSVDLFDARCLARQLRSIDNTFTKPERNYRGEYLMASASFWRTAWTTAAYLGKGIEFTTSEQEENLLFSEMLENILKQLGYTPGNPLLTFGGLTDHFIKQGHNHPADVASTHQKIGIQGVLMPTDSCNVYLQWTLVRNGATFLD